MRRDYEIKVTNLNDRNVDLERTIMGLKKEQTENDQLMQRFAEEVRAMDIEIDRKQRDQDALDRRNQNLQKEVDMYREKDAKYNQTRISLEEETQRRVSADAEADRLRMTLGDLQSRSNMEIEN